MAEKKKLTPAQIAMQKQIKAEREAKVATLTPREADVFYELLEGHSMSEAAENLGIKYCTVNTHITGIYKKLGVKSRPNLLIQYGSFRKKDIF
ncbi:MAG: helix-turn-helix transcriptional regulator [Lachnospiraceae bacterium]|nr:helix-turn-helix transcriptional regulator [Lachnospiraceae bacterium]